jgi:hypothetical protein
MKSRIIAVAALATLVIGCSDRQLNLLPTADISAQISTPDFEGEYTTATGAYSITKRSQEIKFFSGAGAVGAVVTSLRVEYQDGAGQPIASAPGFTESLNVRVEPGKACKEGVGDDCTVNATDVIYNPGPVTDPTAVTLVKDALALAFLQEGAIRSIPTNWRAKITFSAKDDNGKLVQWTDLATINCGKCTIN